jgi:hypothetical protein
VAQETFPSGTQAAAAETLKEKVSEAAGAVQQASADAYDAVKETVKEQPFVLGLLVGGLIGLALGALWKMNSTKSNPSALYHPLEAARHYAEPHFRALRDSRWW